MKELSVGASLAWKIAGKEAAKTKQHYIEKEHLLIGMCSFKKLLDLDGNKLGLNPEERQALQTEHNAIKKLLHEVNLNTTQLRQQIRQKLGVGSHKHSEESVVHRSEACKQVFQQAKELTASTEPTSCLHLLAALLDQPGDIITAVFREAGVTPADLRQQILANIARSGADLILARISDDDLSEIRDFRLREQCSMLTIMFDDVVGSVALCTKLGEPTYQRLRKEHDEAVKEILTKHGKGEIIKSTGDGLLIVFKAPSDAVQCALDIQKRFQGHEWLKLRIGIDVGQVQETTGPASRDVFGLPVATACRIMGLSDGGHILTSKFIYEEAKKWLLPEQISWKPLGMRRCKPGEPTLDVHEVYDSKLTTPMAEFSKTTQEIVPPSYSVKPYLELSNGETTTESQDEKPDTFIDRQQIIKFCKKFFPKLL